MAGGLLPSLREYAARLRAHARAAARGAARRPGDAPGTDERGRRDRARGRRRPGDRVITEQVRNGVAVRMALLYLLAGGPDARAAASAPWLSRRDLEPAPGWSIRRRARGSGRARRRRTGGSSRSTLARWRGRATASTPDGVVVAPGFVDLHAHFREPGNEEAETIATGLAAAAHGGFTTVCLMPNTDPADRRARSVLRAIRAAAVASGSPVEALAYGA